MDLLNINLIRKKSQQFYKIIPEFYQSAPCMIVRRVLVVTQFYGRIGNSYLSTKKCMNLTFSSTLSLFYCYYKYKRARTFLPKWVLNELFDGCLTAPRSGALVNVKHPSKCHLKFLLNNYRLFLEDMLIKILSFVT